MGELNLKNLLHYLNPVRRTRSNVRKNLLTSLSVTVNFTKKINKRKNPIKNSKKFPEIKIIRFRLNQYPHFSL